MASPERDGLPLDLPSRATKPRDRGLTSVIDRGLSIAEVDGMIEVAGDSVDIVKLGWGTAMATGNLEAKLARYRDHGIPVVLGGTLTELAITQGRVAELADWIERLGLRHVEVSDGTITLDPAQKRRIISELSERFTVLSEVGSKDVTHVMAPYRWVEEITAELEAGAWKVLCEGRETGTAGIARADGELREGLIDEIVHAIDLEHLIFEAPQKDQQVHFLRRFGPDVSFGNVAPHDVLALETMRLGLRSDTMGRLP